MILFFERIASCFYQPIAIPSLPLFEDRCNEGRQKDEDDRDEKIALEI